MATPEQVKQAQQIAAEQQSIDHASPTLDALVSEFGTDSLVTKPDGSWEVHYRRPDLTQYENDQRGRKFTQMMRQRVERSREVSFEREARRESVAVRHPDGTTMLVPAKREDRISRKAGYLPAVSYGRRRRRINTSGELVPKPLRTWAEIQAEEQ